MTSRDRIVLVVVLAVGALGGFWMLALKPKRQEAAKLGKDLSTAQQRLDQARSDLQAGQAAKASYSANYSAVARLGKAVPSDDDVPSLVYQLDSTADATGVDFRSVKLNASAGSAPASTTAANAAAATSDSAKSANGGDAKGQQSGSASQGPANQSPNSGGQQNGASNTKPQGATSTPAASTAPTPNPAAPTQSATATLPPGAVVGPAGLSTMPFSFRFTGSFFRLSDFLARLEHYITPRRDTIDVNGRLLLINGIALNAAQSGFPSMQASISATAYLVPPDEGTFAGATPQGPAGSGSSQQPVSSSSPAPSPAPAATVKP